MLDIEVLLLSTSLNSAWTNLPHSKQKHRYRSSPSLARDRIMILPTPFITFLPLLIPLTTALPTIPHDPLYARDTSLAAAETWHIPRLDMHMMSTSTGIPGNGPWPEGSKFDSTIDFDVLVPEEAPLPASTWNCKGTMKNGTIIEDVVGCVDGKGDVGDVSFGMTGYKAVGERRAELSFWLWVYRVGYVLLYFPLVFASVGYDGIHVFRLY